MSDAAGRDLRWVQPRYFRPIYELRAGEQVLATLAFRNSFGSAATGESADGCWNFKRIGFLGTQVTIRACGSESDIALFRNSTWGSGGSLEMPDGRKLPANINFSATRYQLMAQPGVPVLTFNRIGGLLRLSGDVLVHDTARVMPELPWLVILGWYLTVMMHRDSAVAVAC
jgi:hypothetical protein